MRMNSPVPSVRLIRKYPNRRLYDTGRSAYIALEDIRSLVLAREDFRVVDARNGDDLTHAVLLQVFTEGEVKGPGLFTPDALRRLIVAQNGPSPQRQTEATLAGMQAGLSLAQFLEASLQDGVVADGRDAQGSPAVPT